MKVKNSKLIEVCNMCMTASCWYGEELCDKSRYAGTTVKTVAELRKLKLEHQSQWTNEKLMEVYGEVPDFSDRLVK
jgi:hypothetical protein